MPLHVTLTKNTLGVGLPLRPRIVQRNKVSYEEILRFMATDTALEVTDLRSAFDRFVSMLGFYLAKGDRVETPMGTFAAHVSGRRNGDPDRPEITADGVRLRYTPTPEFYQQVQNSIAIEVLKERKGVIEANIQHISSIDDPTLEHQLKLGHLVHLVGDYVEFEVDKPDEGVFFVSEADGSEYRSQVYSRHGSRIVNCKLPELPPGDYKVHLRNRLQPEKLGSGSYSHVITVTE